MPHGRDDYNFFENFAPPTQQLGQEIRIQLEEEVDFLKETPTMPSFKGCGYSILQASLELLNIQTTIYGWINASLDGLLRYILNYIPFKLVYILKGVFHLIHIHRCYGFRIVHPILPRGNHMPTTRRWEIRFVWHMDYNCVHACHNNCILFQGPLQDAKTCPKFGESHYK